MGYRRPLIAIALSFAVACGPKEYRPQEASPSRGEGATDKDMLEAIQGPLNEGFRWGNGAYERQLERLAREETAPVRAAACEKLRELGKRCD